MRDVYTRRYNVFRTGKRTSVTIDKTLSDLFCVYLGCDHHSEEADKVVTRGIQKIIDDGGDSEKSKMIQTVILLQICQDEVREQFVEYSTKRNKMIS